MHRVEMMKFMTHTSFLGKYSCYDYDEPGICEIHFLYQERLRDSIETSGTNGGFKGHKESPP